MLIRTFLSAAFLCAACATAAPPLHTPDPIQLAEAAVALQGSTSDLFFRDDDLAAAAEAIAAVRRERPDLRDVRASSQSPLRLTLTDSAWRELVARFPDPAGDELRPRLGLPALDSVNAELGARGTRIAGREFGRTVEPIFDRPVNLPAMADWYRGVPGVRYAGATQFLFGEPASGISVRLGFDTVGVHLGRGWGDCMSGCIYNRRWSFRYDRRTRRVTQLSDSGDPTPTAGLDQWLRRPDWAAFDRLDEDQRHAYAAAMAEDADTPLGIIRSLAPRLLALPNFDETDTLLARREVRRDRVLMGQLAALSDGGAARKAFFDDHGVAAARDPRTAPAAIRALAEELTYRDPPPPLLSRLLLRHPVVRGDPRLMLHVIREVQPLGELMREGCREYLALGHPVWERSATLDGSPGPWTSSLPCTDLLPPPPVR